MLIRRNINVDGTEIDLMINTKENIISILNVDDGSEVILPGLAILNVIVDNIQDMLDMLDETSYS